MKLAKLISVLIVGVLLSGAGAVSAREACLWPACKNLDLARQQAYMKDAMECANRIKLISPALSQQQKDDCLRAAEPKLSSAQISWLRHLEAENASENEKRFEEERRQNVDKQMKTYALGLLIATAVFALVCLIAGFGWLAALGWIPIFGLPYLMIVDAKGFSHNLNTMKEQPWEMSPLLVPILVGAILVLRGFWVRARKVKDRTFTVDQDAMRYTRHDLKLSVDGQRQMVMVNGTAISPGEFSSWTKNKMVTKYHSTGSTQTVYGSGGAVGSVYIPGEGYSTEHHVGYEAHISCRKNDQSTPVVKAEFTLKSKASFDALVQVLESIKKWCTGLAQDSAVNALDTLCAKAGLDKEFMSKARWGKDGVLLEAIAVDRTGKSVAVCNDGAETWMGTLKGASASIVDGKLEVKVDDPAYRERHLAERHFSILHKEPREVLVEWESRIGLLAKSAALTC